MNLNLLFAFFYFYVVLNSNYCSGIRILKNSQILTTSGLPFLMKDTFNVHNKKIITLSPGGFRGFYIFGLCRFLKENYDLEEYVFSGASAGAWNSLFLTFKGDSDSFVENIFDIDFKNISDLNLIEKEITKSILNNYNTSDFELERLYVGTTVFKRFRFKPVVYTDFEDLEDALKCCIASSHIPFITGRLFYKYRGLYSFDGGFSKYPYVNGVYSDIHITPSIWKEEISNKLLPSLNIRDYTNLLSKDKLNLKELYLQGYKDAEDNKKRLDSLFK